MSTGRRKGQASVEEAPAPPDRIVIQRDVEGLATRAAMIAAGLVSRGDDLQTTQSYGAIAQAAVTIAQEIQREAERRG